MHTDLETGVERLVRRIEHVEVHHDVRACRDVHAHILRKDALRRAVRAALTPGEHASHVEARVGAALARHELAELHRIAAFVRLGQVAFIAGLPEQAVMRAPGHDSVTPVQIQIAISDLMDRAELALLTWRECRSELQSQIVLSSVRHLQLLAAGRGLTENGRFLFRSVRRGTVVVGSTSAPRQSHADPCNRFWSHDAAPLADFDLR